MGRTGAKVPGDTSKREPEKEQEVGSPGLEKGRGAIRARRDSQSFQDRKAGEVLQSELDFQASGLSLKMPCGTVTLITNHWQVKCAVP